MKTTLLCMMVSVLLFSCTTDTDRKLITSPPMGWNSFDSYGVYLHHDAAMRNIEELAKRYKQFGYEYFVIDAGWFGEFRLRPGTMYSTERHAKDVHINEYGLLQPSKTYFPHGLKVLADKAHSLGLKFGVHIMRGIPKKAYELNTPIQGTNYTARDIADTINVCKWCPQNYGVDVTKPGGPEFYNSLINQLASWGVDYIKADDIVPYPLEVEALVNAIEQSGRDIVLSLSPGGRVDQNAISSFKRAQLLRVTGDVWDDQRGINNCFAAWRKWQGYEEEDFYIDMDMIPFGELQIMSPKRENTIVKSAQKKLKEDGVLSNLELLSGKGTHRRSEFSKDQQLTFITQRALSASPLMIGGDLVSMDDFSYSLLTNLDVIECNQNGVMGELNFDRDRVEVWRTESIEDKNSGWIGIFNRNNTDSKKLVLSNENLGLAKDGKIKLFDIWNKEAINNNQSVSINPNGVLFVKYCDQ